MASVELPPSRRARRATLAIGIAFYFAACAAPAMRYAQHYVEPSSASRYALADSATVQGIVLLTCGWLGLFSGELAWFANPCLVLSWIGLAARSHRLALPAAWLGLLLAGALLGRSPVTLYSVAGLYTMTPVSYLPGSWLWIASLAATAAGTTAYWRLAARTAPR